jgi:hypothetical protein
MVIEALNDGIQYIVCNPWLIPHCSQMYIKGTQGNLKMYNKLMSMKGTSI